MTDPNYTHITAVVDISGSMWRIKTDMEGGFNAFIADQRKQAGRCTVTLNQFNNEYETVYTAQPIADVPPLELHPNGNTALHDALGRTITDTGARLAALPEHERPGTVIVIVVTDGLENASREYTGAVVRQMVQSQERRYNWRFIYLGANQDAVEVGDTIGIAAGNSLTYNPTRVEATFTVLSSSVNATRAGNAADFTGAQRNLAAGTRPVQDNPQA